jgi:hypothetical protein
MAEYVLNLYQPDGPIPEPEILDAVMRRLDAINEEIKAAGSWVFSGGLHDPSTATVIRPKDPAAIPGGEVIMTDGPFTEGKEHIGGFWIIDAPDLDAALEWGRKATLATGLPVEVRPFRFRRPDS